jgi:O-antigen ligase
MKLSGLFLMVPVTTFTLLATERRAGYIAIMVGFLAYALIFLMTHRKAFFTFVIPVVLAGIVYLPIFWNNTSMLGQPARAVRSLISPDPRDASSNLYRDLELINVRATIKANGLLGVGFGKPFYFVVPLPDLSWWPFWQYEPHHNVLWVWLKMGAIGFIIFFTLMGTALARCAHIVRNFTQPEHRVFAMFALAAIVTTLVFGYVDLAFVSGRVTVFLGTILGTLAVLHQIKD